MKRSLALGLGTAAVLAVAGCSQNGSYRLSWNFQIDGATVSSAVGCGRSYVDSILVTGVDTSGDAQQVRAICTPGSFTSTAPDGSWSFQIQMLNAQGALIPSMASTQTPTAERIASGAPQAQFPIITLMPLPASSGGSDGGVDVADSGGVDVADSGHNVDSSQVDVADSGPNVDSSGMHE